MSVIESHEPVVLKRTGKEVEEVHLFSIEDEETGKTKDYYIPKKVHYNVTLQALQIAAVHGETAAAVFAMETLLGEEGYQALLEFDELEEEQFNEIAEISNKIVFGDRKGKANRAGRRASKR